VGRALHRATLPARRAVLRRRLGQLTVTDVEGIPIVVMPRVFHPGVFRTSGVLARAVRDAGIVSGTRVLDLGTGTGVIGVVAAGLGATVTAADVNPDAVRCARINAILNAVDDRMTVVQSDLFDGVPGPFDLIAFNPPFFEGPPRDPLDEAWRSVGVIDRFAAGVGACLAPEGRALVAFSNHADQAGFVAAVSTAALVVRSLRAEDLGDEVVTVFEIRHPDPAR
jgi:release factor glutamine methyltransferase